MTDPLERAVERLQRACPVMDSDCLTLKPEKTRAILTDLRRDVLLGAATIAKEKCLPIDCTAIEAAGVVRRTRNLIATELRALAEEE